MNNIQFIRHSYILLALLMLNCSLDRKKLTDPNLPYWSTHLELPLMAKTITFDDILSDSMVSKIPKDENGVSTLFAFLDTIPIKPIIFKTQIAIEPFSDGISSKLGPIELSAIDETSTPKFQFVEIFPQAQDFDGHSIPEIPSFDLPIITKYFSFDDFEEATFTSGNLKLKINNQLPISLNNITVILLKKSDASVIAVITFTNSILPGNPDSTSMDLSTKTLPGDIEVIVAGKSDGGTQIPVDLDDDYFEVLIGADNLVVSSAKAKIPYQNNPITNSGNIVLQDSDNRVKSAQFDVGYLKIEINNQVDLSASLNMHISAIQDNNGHSDTWKINLPRMSFVDTVFVLTEKNLIIYSDAFDVTNVGFDAYPQQVPYSYEIALDPTGDDLRLISEDDKIDVAFYFYGESENNSIAFTKITGKIKDFEEKISSTSQTISGIPKEMEGIEVVAFDNGIGNALELIMELVVPDFGQYDLADTGEKTLGLLLNMAISGSNEEATIVDSTTINGWNIIDSSRIHYRGFEELVNMKPDFITIFGDARITDENEIITFTIPDQIEMTGNIIMSIPFVFQFSDSARIEMDPELMEQNKIPEKIESMILFVDYENQFDFGIEISVLMALDTMYFLENSIVTPDTFINFLMLQPKTVSRDSVVLSSSRFDLFSEPIYLKTNIHLLGENTVYFLSTDSLILKISASMEYKMNYPDE